MRFPMLARLGNALLQITVRDWRWSHANVIGGVKKQSSRRWNPIASVRKPCTRLR